MRFDWFGCFKETVLTFNIKQTERSTDLEVWSVTILIGLKRFVNYDNSSEKVLCMVVLVNHGPKEEKTTVERVAGF